VASDRNPVNCNWQAAPCLLKEFATYKVEGMARGLKVVESGPMVRSSYHADHQADELTDILSLRR